MFDCCLCCSSLKYSRGMAHVQEFNHYRKIIKEGRSYYYRNDDLNAYEKAQRAFQNARYLLEQVAVRTDTDRAIEAHFALGELHAQSIGSTHLKEYEPKVFLSRNLKHPTSGSWYIGEYAQYTGWNAATHLDVVARSSHEKRDLAIALQKSVAKIREESAKKAKDQQEYKAKEYKKKQEQYQREQEERRKKEVEAAERAQEWEQRARWEEYQRTLRAQQARDAHPELEPLIALKEREVALLAQQVKESESQTRLMEEQSKRLKDIHEEISYATTYGT